jgi:hypothetical protein
MIGAQHVDEWTPSLSGFGDAVNEHQIGAITSRFVSEQHAVTLRPI